MKSLYAFNKKNWGIIGVIFVAMLFLCTEPIAAEDKPEFEWKAGCVYVTPQPLDTFNSAARALRVFTDLVNQRSGGRLTITPYYRTLGGNVELFDQLRRGELEVYYGQPLGGADIRFSSWGLPFLFKNYDEVDAAACNPDGPVFKLSEQWLAEHNIKLLGVSAMLFRGFANNKRPVKSLADLKDLKVRVYQDPVVTLFWKNVANPLPLPFSEVYGALQLKTVDGLEFAAKSILSTKVYEVLKYYTDIDWQWTSGGNLCVNMDVWNKLPEDLQIIVQDSANDAMLYESAQARRDSMNAVEELKKHGMEVHYLTPEARAEFMEMAKELAPEFRELIGPEVYDQVIEAVESVRK